MAIAYCLSLPLRGVALLTGIYILLAPTLSAADTASTWDRAEFTEVRLIAATDTVGYDETIQLGLQFRMDPGWKIYWRSPGDAGSPPVLNFEGSTNIVSFEIDWPAPERFMEAGDLETVGYLDGVVFPIRVQLETIEEKVLIHALIEYQTCKTICIPITAAATLELPSGPTAPNAFAELIDRYLAKVPGTLEDASITIETISLTGTPPTQVLELGLQANKTFSDPSLLVEGPRDVRFSRETKHLSPDSRNVIFHVPVETRVGQTIIGKQILITLVDGAHAIEFPIKVTATAHKKLGLTASLLFPILGIALLGGLILNLMPCVLPVLAIKILGVIRHGGGESRQVRSSFLASAGGIIFSFLVLAAGATALKLVGIAVGWGMQFQEPLFLVFLILVLTVFSCNLFGFFEITMPTWIGRFATPTNADGRNSTLGASFWTGALATLLATPCSAPFLGSAVGFALSRGPVEIILIFAALGIGMASPYLLLAAMPTFATCLPKPGAWMGWVRRAMGASLVGTVIWLLSVVSAQVGLLNAGILAVLMVICGLILWLACNGTRTSNRVSLAAIGLIGAIALILPQAAFLPNSTINSRNFAQDHWQEFDVSEIGLLVEAGNTIFVDITAEWCLTCKVNKSLVLNKAKIVEQLTAPGTITMRGDWTKPDPVIAEYLATFGRYGLPFNVIYGPGTPLGSVLPELLSENSVVSALQQAKGMTDKDSKQKIR